jgi:hypothetical protein
MSDLQIVEPVTPQHPFYPFGKEELDYLLANKTPEEINTFISQRNQRIKLEEEDPLNYGRRLEPWEDSRKLLEQFDVLTLSGGHRGSKTTFCVDYCVDTLVNGPAWLKGREKDRRKKNLNVAFFHSSHKSSVIQQQYQVYQFLPPEMRDMGRSKEDKHVNINFSRKNGFSDNMFVLPNNNVGLFFQYTQDPKEWEGYEFDLVWCDELLPLNIFEILTQRLTTRRGKLISSFVPVNGYTPMVKKMASGSKVVKSLKADPAVFPDLLDAKGELPVLVKGCPKGQMPYISHCRDSNASIIYFHTIFNPYNPYDESVKKMENKSATEVKMRLYGYTDKMEGGAFPKFNPNVHVFKREAWKTIKDLPGSNFVVCDPGGSNKNWFIKWYRCTSDGNIYLYREWPDLQRYGEWAMPSEKVDYEQGPAQRLEAGRGIAAYKRLVLELEGWTYDEERGLWDDTNAEVIEERLMDARFSVDAKAGEGTSILALMDEEQTNDRGHVVGPMMLWNQARGNGAMGGMKPTEIGLQMIAELMDYNEDRPVNAMNQPRWYVHEDCAQSIYCYQEYTALGTEKCALKDLADCDRYLVSSDVSFIDKDGLECIGGGSY